MAFALSDACLRLDLQQEARRHLLGSIRQRPDYAPAHRMLAQVYAKQGEIALAEKHRLIAEELQARSPAQLRRVVAAQHGVRLGVSRGRDDRFRSRQARPNADGMTATEFIQDRPAASV